MYETIEYDGDKYLKFQASGNASQFALPFAKHFCKGFGFDIGYCKEEWKLPGAVGIDHDPTGWNAMNLPVKGIKVDYIYSSHCLEHLVDWVAAIEYWSTVLPTGGVLFLYLPHPDQKYWNPWNNRKHFHVLHPQDVKNCMKKFGFIDIFVSEKDLNHSYMIVGKKV